MQEKVMALRGVQWLQIFHEQAQSGQSVKQWCGEHRITCSTYYRWKRALREQLLEQMESKQGELGLDVITAAPENEPQFAALTLPETVRRTVPLPGSAGACNAPAIRIRIREVEIEVPDGIKSSHLETVLKAVQGVR